MGRKKLSVNEAVWEIIRLAQSSVADTCIIPIQDYLCLGNEARINHPSTLGGNWIDVYKRQGMFCGKRWSG